MFASLKARFFQFHAYLCDKFAGVTPVVKNGYATVRDFLSNQVAAAIGTGDRLWKEGKAEGNIVKQIKSVAVFAGFVVGCAVAGWIMGFVFGLVGVLLLGEFFGSIVALVAIMAFSNDVFDTARAKLVCQRVVEEMKGFVSPFATA